MSNYKGKFNRKIHDKAIGKEHQPTGWIKKISIVFFSCILALTLATPMLHATDGLEIGPEIVGEAVTQIKVKEPTVNPVLYDATTISGKNLAKAKVNKQTVIATVHVSLKDSSGTEKANRSVTPKRGTEWSVDLPEGVKVAKGDTATVYQQIGEDKSSEVTAVAQPSKASTVTLTMPTGELWVEEYVANVLNADEKAEAIDLLKKANPTIDNDIKSVEFKITGTTTKTASYTVTYKDGSVSGEIQAPDLTVKQVTEHSRKADLNEITVVDNVIKGKLEGEGPFDGIKVQLIVNVKKEKSGDFCTDKGCKIDKDSSNPVGVKVESDGTFSYTLQEQNKDSLEIDQIVGVSVKEPHKFVSCSTTTVKPVTPEKTEVKDPRKLTGDDKGKIIEAIKKAYRAKDGTSKLPNGTSIANAGVPAVIQFDDSGNVKIFSGNDVEVTHDSNWNPVPVKNADGSYKVKDGAQPKITIPAKDLVKNIKPEKPAVKLSDDKKSITIAPNKVDTDAHIITVSYKGIDGNDQTTTATKADDGTWSIVGEGTVVDGVITLPKNKVKGGTDVTAEVTDKGGIADDDKDSLTSDKGELQLTLTKAEQVKELGGLDPVDMKKWVGDDVDWKDGVRAKDSVTEADKEKINTLLKEAKTTIVDENSRGTTTQGDYKGKIKVTFDDGSFLEVEQTLYVSNFVTGMDRKDKVPTDALDVEFKLGEGTKVNNTGSGAIEGNKDNPTSYSKYKVKPNTNLKEYKIPIINASAVDSIQLSAQDGYTDPTWNTNNFVATTKNNVFTATSTKTFKVTVKPNGGIGDEKVEIKKKNETFKLPAANTFTPPNENQEFSGWKIGDDTNLKQPETEITITADTEINAIWKPIEFKVDFKAGEGASGSMKDKTVTKGSEYELPTPTFTAPKDKVFAGWKVGDQVGVKQAKERITISGNVTLTATWKDIMVNVSYNANGGSGKMEGKELKKGSTLKLPTNGFTAPSDKQEFKTWEVDGKEVTPGTEITIEKDTEVKAIWKDIEYKVTFDGNTGTGLMDSATVKKGKKYKLPENAFGAPSDKQEFKTWEVDGKEVDPGTEITIEKDTEVKAIWKDIEYKVTFDGNTGTGLMDSATVKKGKKYKLPENAFGAPSDKQEFKTWEVDGKEVAPGTEITIEKDTEVKAIWKDIMIKIIYDPNGGNWNNDSANRTIEVKKGTTITIMNAPVKDGFKFKYWKGSEYQPGDTYTALENHTFIAAWEENKKPGNSNVNPSEPGLMDKNGTQSHGTSSLNSKNDRTPNTGDNGMNMLYAFGLAFATCGVLVINRIYRKEK